MPSFSSRTGVTIPTARRFFIECLLTRAVRVTLSRFLLINFYARKSPYEYVHSVKIELTKVISVGTRITYQATGAAGGQNYMKI